MFFEAGWLFAIGFFIAYMVERDRHHGLKARVWYELQLAKDPRVVEILKRVSRLDA